MFTLKIVEQIISEHCNSQGMNQSLNHWSLTVHVLPTFMGYVEGVVIVQDTGILHPCEIVGNSVVSIPTTDDSDSLNT